jgi:hypothetical protein
MSKKKQIGIQWAAVLMLLLFTGIMANNILCNYAHAIDASGVAHDHPFGHDHHHKAPKHEHNHDHDHNHQHDEAPPEKEHKDKGHNHNDQSDHDCCNELTLVFFSTLQRDEAPDFTFNLTAFSVDLPQLVYKSQLVEKNLFRGIANYAIPPPKIPDIRVFLHSFQV